MNGQKPADNVQKDNPISSISTEPLWTIDDVAKYLRLEPNTVREMARDKKIPGIKVGRVWRFRPKEIKSWLGSDTGNI